MPHVIPQFPHCDQNILHAPGECSYCDEHPDWQELRETWGINFSGHNDPEKAPCPAERRRSIAQAHRWPGNRPHPKGELPPDPLPRSAFERLRKSPFEDS